MALITQNQRLFSLQTPLGPDKLLVNSIAGTEQLSELFKFELELVSEDFSIDWDQIVDKNVTVGIRQSDGTSFRYINGYISNFEPSKHDGRLAYYCADLVPWTWYLTLTTDNLIYQEKTVVEVIEATFQKYGFQDYDVSSLGDRHAKWMNCCQYGESAFTFVSRLMEVEGIYYFYKHEQGKHTMMLVDHLSAHVPCPFQSAIRLDHEVGAGLLRQEDTIFLSNMTKNIRPNKHAHKDFNFEIPSHQLYFEAPVQGFMGSNRNLEVYDYPGDFDWEKDAPDWGDLRQEELAVDRVEVAGNGNCRSLIPGYRFDLTQHDRPEQNLNYLVTKVTHKGHEGSWIAGTDIGSASYENTFESMPSSVQYRPGRKTESPNIQSIQTAKVVGPKGEEIYTDEWGRVKVHFHWDRKPADENSSCWIRVMQPIAGPGFGHIWLPRVGQEVVVQFVEGDPDRPLITGCLYNHENHPPYTLPANKNWSGVKTRSTKKGKPTDFNELRFVDTKGSELYVMHAQKDMQVTVENDTIEVVDRDRTLTIKRNQTETVKGDKHNSVSGNFNEDIQGKMSLNVKKDITEKAGGTFILQAGGDIHLKAGGRIVLEAAGGITFLGANGASFINCTAAGVAIQGPQVQLNCGLPLPTGALSAVPTLPSLPNLPTGLNLSSLSSIPNLASATSGITGAVSGVTSGITGAVSGVTSGITGAVSGVTSGITGAVSGVTSGITGAVGGVTSGITGAVGGVTSGITGAVSGVTSGIQGAVGGVTSGIQGAVGGATSGIQGAVSGVTSGIQGAVTSGIQGAVGGATSGIQGAMGGVTSGIQGAVTSGIQGAVGGATSGIQGAVSGVTSGIQGAASGVTPGNPGAASGPTPGNPSAVSGAAPGNPSAMGNVASQLSGAGSGAAPGNPDAMGNVASQFSDAIGGGAPGATDESVGNLAGLASNPWVNPNSLTQGPGTGGTGYSVTGSKPNTDEEEGDK
jgi:type VI secretion system secreted protein VgrG